MLKRWLSKIKNVKKTDINPRPRRKFGGMNSDDESVSFETGKL